MSERTSTATLGGGCFWCLEAVFTRIEGVREVSSGYAGGHVENPTYREVCGGRTGHAEVVQLEFDPEVIGFRDLLEIFFAIHDPTTVNRQGADVGPQYRSIILFHDEEQRRQAEEFIAGLAEEGVWEDPVVTELVPLERFFPAEEEHHRYYDRHPEQGYCRMVISPKLARARKSFAHRLRE